MDLLIVILIVVAAVALLGRGGPAWYRRGSRGVVTPGLRRRVEDDVVVRDRIVEDEPVRRRTIIDEYWSTRTDLVDPY